MTISNVKQKVTSKYSDEFVRIFGPTPPSGVTGTYQVDNDTKCLIKVKDSTSGIIIKTEGMQPLLEKVRDIGPITINRGKGR